MIIELLPLLKGWAGNIYQKQNQTVQPGSSLDWKADYSGWLSWIELEASSPYTKLSFGLFDQPLDLTPYELYLWGISEATPESWITVYDALNSRYGIIHGPRPFKPIDKAHYIKATAPNTDPTTGAAITTPTTITLFRVRSIYITNMALFRESLQEVFGIGAILDALARLIPIPKVPEVPAPPPVQIPPPYRRYDP